MSKIIKLAEENYPETSNRRDLLLFYEQFDMRPLRQAKREAICKAGWRIFSNVPYLIRTWKDNELWHYKNIDCNDDFIITCAKRMHGEEAIRVTRSSKSNRRKVLLTSS